LSKDLVQVGQILSSVCFQVSEHLFSFLVTLGHSCYKLSVVAPI